jgi:hypothetical protein
LTAVVLVLPCLVGTPADAKTPAFEVTYPAKVHQGPVSAQVYVFLGPAQNAGEPRFGPNWLNPQPFFRVEAHDWKAGERLRIGSEALGFPGSLDTVKPGTYSAQAVLRLNPDTHAIGDGEGNAYGPVVSARFDAEENGVTMLTIDHVVPPKRFEETERVRLVDIPSPMLSAFHHRPIRHRAGVVLPEANLTEKRPTLYIVPGFGGDHYGAARMASRRQRAYGEDMIRVVLDPDCGTGHHVFADSAANGPRGRALIEELIPYIEKTYPAIAEPGARLLNGHSSGGWSTLWLQVTYPDFFGGTWSTSPDPVDFRDFQRIDLYAPAENMFRDGQGNRRPIIRRGREAIMFYDVFSKMDDVIGEGGQLRSFEDVFSPLGLDGKARRLWDRSTGAIDPDVARAWEAYDIRLVLERNWKTHGPKLGGKLHVITGDLDTFYLEGAVKLLKVSLKELGSDAVVEIIPDKDHGNLIDTDLARRIDREMKAAVARYQPSKTREPATSPGGR